MRAYNVLGDLACDSENADRIGLSRLSVDGPNVVVFRLGEQFGTCEEERVVRRNVSEKR